MECGLKKKYTMNMNKMPSCVEKGPPVCRLEPVSLKGNDVLAHIVFFVAAFSFGNIARSTRAQYGKTAPLDIQ